MRGKAGRKSARNRVAGKRLSWALGRCGITLVDLCGFPEWKTSRNLPDSPKVVQTWLKTGIPKESMKVESVANFLGVPFELFTGKGEYQFQRQFLDGALFRTRFQGTAFDRAYLEKAAELWFGGPQDPLDLTVEADLMGDAIRRVRIPVDDLSPRALAYGGACAMHVGGSWNVWAGAAMNNQDAARAVLKMTKVTTFRPPLRALYVLGKMCRDPELFNIVHEEFQSLVSVAADSGSPADLSGLAIDEISRIGRDAAHPRKEKALAVLQEIGDLWGDSAAIKAVNELGK